MSGGFFSHSPVRFPICDMPFCHLPLAILPSTPKSAPLRPNVFSINNFPPFEPFLAFPIPLFINGSSA
jgi:hypothetical protein